MKKVAFTEIQKASYVEYHLPCGRGLLDNSLFNYQFKLEKEILEKWNRYLWNTGITYFGTQENSLLYGLLIKKLAPNQDIDLLCFGNPTSLKSSLTPLLSNKVEWKDSFESTTDDNHLCRQYGYQNPTEFLAEMRYFNRDLSNRGYYLYRVRRGTVYSYINTYNSDVSSWSFIIKADWPRLTAILQNPNQRPDIQRILEVADFVVNVQIGGDEGYLDYVSIQSKEKLGGRVQELEKAIFLFGTELENLISGLGIIDEEWKTDAFQGGFEEIEATYSKL